MCGVIAKERETKCNQMFRTNFQSAGNIKKDKLNYLMNTQRDKFKMWGLLQYKLTHFFNKPVM